MNVVGNTMTQEKSDPLDGAAVGETKRVIETVDLYGINMAPDVFIGSDRFGDHDIANVEIIETDDEDYNNIRVTWEGEITKQLPLRWDYHSEPVTESERRTAERRKWLARGLKAASILLPVALSTWVAMVVMSRAAGTMTINGQPMPAPTWGSFAPTVAIVLVVAALIYVGLQGGFPGRARAR